MARIGLSSSLTGLYKFVFPVLSFGVFAFGSLSMFMDRIPEAFVYCGTTGLGAAFLIRIGMKLKFVDVDEQFVYLRNCRRRVSVPLSEVVSVQQRFLLNIKPAFIVFRTKTPYGKWIMFMAKRTGGQLGVDSAINLIRDRAGFSGEWRRDV